MSSKKCKWDYTDEEVAKMVSPEFYKLYQRTKNIVSVVNEDEKPYRKYLKPFGTLSAESFYNIFYCFFNIIDEEDLIDTIDTYTLEDPNWRKNFLDAFREMIQDPYLSFSKKVAIYLNADASWADGEDTLYPEEKAVEKIKKCWNLVAQNEPWPLDQE